MKTPILVSLLFASFAFASTANAGLPTIDPVPVPEPTFQLPQNGACSSADGSLRFESSQYQGGAAPFPGMLVGEDVLTVDDVEWGHSLFFASGGEAENQIDWPLEVEMTEGAVVLSEGSAISGRVIYTAKMTVEHLTADVAPKTSFVICEDSWILAP